MHAGKSSRLHAHDVILVTIDTLRADHVGCYGDRNIQTPALDGLAQDGLRFESAFTPSPITNTSHTSILTGLYPSSHGVTDFGVPLRSGTATLAHELKQHGYATAAFIGAVILDSKTLAPGLDRGFDFYDNFPSGMPKTASRYGRVERRGMEVVRHAERWLRQHPPGKQPRFIWVHLYDPHDPYDPPPPFAQMYRGRLYDGEIAYADSALKDFLHFVRQQGTYGQSLIVVVGDHGEGLGEHGEDTHGIFLYDSTTHVPLIIKLPQSAGPSTALAENKERKSIGGIVTAQVRTIDLMPTILGVLNFPLPSSLDGVSLAPLWQNRAQNSPTSAGDRIAIGETDYPLRFGWSPLKSVRVSGEKYIEAPRPEFYDLAADPQERKNAYEPWNGQVQKLRGVLAEFREHEKKTPVNANADVTTHTIDELKALGYLGTNPGSTTAAEPTLLPDPKDKIQIQNLLHIAMLADEDGRPELARTSLEKALTLDPSSPTALTQLGQIELAEGNYKHAAELLARAMAVRPEAATAYDEGRARFAEGDLTGARDALEASLKLSPGQYDARTLLGRAYAGLKQWEKAQDQLEAAVFLNGKLPEARLELARVLIAERQPRQALMQLESASHSAGATPELYDLMAEAYSSLGDKTQAARAAARARALKSPHSRR